MAADRSEKKLAVDWSFLPGPALNLISDHLPFDFDYIRFRSVCSSWRSGTHKRPQLPLFATFIFDPENQKTICRFSSLTSEPMMIYEELDHYSVESLYFGFSRGWMAMYELDNHIILINPVTEEQIDLPANPNFVHSRNYEDIEICRPTGIVLSADPYVDHGFLALHMPGIRENEMALLKHGDDSWSLIPHPNAELANDALFYKGMIFFACGSDVYAYNLGLGAGQTMMRISMADPPPNFLIFDGFLVESLGDLLLVLFILVSENDEDEEDENANVNIEDGSNNVTDMIFFGVFKVDLSRMELVEIDSLGDRSIFLGRNNSMSVCASMYFGCIANCVYYSHRDDTESYMPVIKRVCLEGHCYEMLTTYGYDCCYGSAYLASLWVAPNLLSGPQFQQEDR